MTNSSWETQLQSWHTQQAINTENLRLEQHFEIAVQTCPDRIAVHDLNLNVGMTFAELNHKSDLLSQRLVRTFKNHDQQVILVFLDAGILFPLVILSILKSGFIFLPIDSNSPIDRIRFIIKDANVRMVITQGRYLNLFSQNVASGLIPSNLYVLDAEKKLEFISPLASNASVQRNSNEAAYCIYTGGNNGQPGVIVPHRAVSHAIRCEVAYYLKHSSKRLSLASHSSDAVISDYFAGFAAKCTVFVMDWTKFSVNPASVIVENRIDTLHCTPTRLAAIDAENLAKLDHKLEIIMFGGNDTMPPSLLEKWLRLFPHTMFINCYGPTETTLQVSMKKFNFKDNLLNRTHVNISIGKPFPGSAFYVVDPKVRGKNVHLMGPGQIGELYIGGVQVCSGYLNRPNETSEVFVPDPYGWHSLSSKRLANGGKTYLFRTGDLVCWNTDGELEFRGKMENAFAQVKGRRVDLFVVKGIIERIPEIMMAALNLEQDEQGRDSVVAYVKLKIDSTLIEIIRECKRRLEPHEMPYKFVRVEEFPTVGNGRIDFKKLSDNESAVVAHDSKYSSPKLTHKEPSFPLQFLTPEVISQDERVIAKIILGKASIALNQSEISDFSDDVDLINVCGMNSITAAKLCSMIRNIYPTVEIDAHYIMQYCKTPAEIASRISSSMEDHTSPFFLDNTRFVSTSVNESQSSSHSYTLTDQASLFYGVAFYSKYPAWLVNSFRRKFYHAVRIYEFIQFKPLKGDTLDPYYNRIDPIRLHNAIERLFEAHPVLCTRLVPLKKGFSFFGGYSKTVSINMRTAPLLVPVDKIVFSRLCDVRIKMEQSGLVNYDGNIAVAYSLEDLKIVIALNHAIGDVLFANILVRHLELFYNDPKRRDIPIYRPLDRQIMESKVLNLYPNMDKYSHMPCFNFPVEGPSISNSFAGSYGAIHDRIIVNVMIGKTTDTMTEGIPIVTSAIVFVCGYLSQKYRQKNSSKHALLITSFNEMRTIHIPGYSGLSIHQLCNVMKFSCSTPCKTSRVAFKEAYQNRIPYRLSPEERIVGVSSHSLDINIQINSASFCSSFLFNQCGRLTNTASSFLPVAMGGMCVDMLIASDMDGIFLSFQVSRTVPNEIREEFIPLLIDQLFKCRLVAYAIGNNLK